MLGRELRFPGRVEGGVTLVMTGGGDKLCPGENKEGVVSIGLLEGAYKSNESMEEKA